MATAATTPVVLTVTEAAARFRVSSATVRRLIKSGQLDAGRVGRQYRIREDAAEQLLTGNAA